MVKGAGVKAGIPHSEVGKKNGIGRVDHSSCSPIAKARMEAGDIIGADSLTVSVVERDAGDYTKHTCSQNEMRALDFANKLERGGKKLYRQY